MKTFKEMVTGNIQESSNQNFIDAVLRHLKGADEKTIRMVMNAMADGKHSKAARILGNVKPAKGDLGNIKESTLQEGSGKRNFKFTGKDEIGKFWVVLNATSGNEVLEDILFEADIFDMMLQQRGGLDIPSIEGIYKSKSKAKKVAEKIAEQAFRDLVNTAK